MKPLSWPGPAFLGDDLHAQGRYRQLPLLDEANLYLYNMTRMLVSPEHCYLDEASHPNLIGAPNGSDACVVLTTCTVYTGEPSLFLDS